MRSFNLIIKRVFDVIASLAGIVLLSPLLLIICIAIKVTSKGPVLFTQQRLGKNGVTFNILKYRTMVVGAETIGDGLTVKSEADDRITKIGRFLRKTSLDELPQLFNVLDGSMSLIGPRPPATYFPYDGFKSYSKQAQKRFLMKPGITGLAQVTVRNAASWDDRIVIDTEYIRNFTFGLDMKILFLTVRQVFSKDNIYMDEK